MPFISYERKNSATVVEKTFQAETAFLQILGLFGKYFSKKIGFGNLI